MINLTCDTNKAVALFRAAAMDCEPVIFPTDTIYGIGAPITSVEANSKIYDIKKRVSNNPFPILVGSWEQVATIANVPSEAAMGWLKAVWPGPFTIILHASDFFLHNFFTFTKDGTIAVRMVSTKWLRDAIVATDIPMTATSVNISGTPPLTDPIMIHNAFKDQCKYMLWGDAGNKPSTIIDITAGNNQTLRG